MNAKTEFLDFCNDKSRVKCASLHFGKDYGDNEIDYINLKTFYSQKGYEDFLTKLDIKYDNGFGGQNLFGTIWFEDETWAGRGEYDGSEWWEYYKCPDIPSELKR